LVTDWPSQVEAPERDFLSVLTARRSRTGTALSDEKLAPLLRHATQLRSRQGDGRFGPWESRTAPAAGGLHAIRILALPTEASGSFGLYDERVHGLRAPADLATVRELNRQSVLDLTGAQTGTTLQLVADGPLYASCYENWETLMWRDAGALCAVLAFVATALSLNSVVLGRHGDDIISASELPSVQIAVGAVHVGE